MNDTEKRPAHSLQEWAGLDVLLNTWQQAFGQG